MKITREMVEQIREQIETAINGVAEEYGLSVQIGTIRFTQTNLRAQIELAATGMDGVVENKEAHEFRCCCVLYRLKPDDLGKWFRSSSGRDMKVVGLTRRSKKYPVICQSADGSRYKFAADMVKYYLENNAVAAK